jgi:hypothetical protein
MSYAFQNSNYNLNYNTPAILSTRFVVGLSTALVSAILAATLACALRTPTHQTKKLHSNIVINSISEDSEGKSSINTSKNGANPSDETQYLKFVF